MMTQAPSRRLLANTGESNGQELLVAQGSMFVDDGSTLQVSGYAGLC